MRAGRDHVRLRQPVSGGRAAAGEVRYGVIAEGRRALVVDRANGENERVVTRFGDGACTRAKVRGGDDWHRCDAGVDERNRVALAVVAVGTELRGTDDLPIHRRQVVRGRVDLRGVGPVLCVRQRCLDVHAAVEGDGSYAGDVRETL